MAYIFENKMRKMQIKVMILLKNKEPVLLQ